MAASAYFREERDKQTRPIASDFAPTLDLLIHMRSDDGDILTKPFLDVCRSTLPVVERIHAVLKSYQLGLTATLKDVYPASRSRLQDSMPRHFMLPSREGVKSESDKFGSSMALVKSDVGGNISRLDAKYQTDTTSYHILYDIVRKEIADKTATQSSSCTNGLLWLTRAMDFLVELFRNLLVHSDWTMTQAANEAYAATLKKWHGWIASAAFTVAMKLVPDRKKFYDLLGGGNLNEDIEKFVTNFAPVLAENHKFLQSVGMDDLKAS